MMRELLKKIDSAVTGGALLRGKRERMHAAFRREREAAFDGKMEFGYRRAGLSTELAELCDQYGSDKGETTPGPHPYVWPSHFYTELYELLFGQARDTIRRVVECGIGTNNPDLVSSMGAAGKPGASLRVWRDYFPNAEVIGADIDSDILFEEERIRTFQCDQTSAASIAAFRERAGLIDGSVDIVIDDGLHTLAAGKAFFEGMWSSVRVGGTYITEDIDWREAAEFGNFIATGLPKNASAMMVDMPALDRPLGYNTLAVIRKAAA